MKTMNPDSSVGDLDYMPIFPETYPDTTDFLVKLMSFDENRANEVTQSFDADRKEIKLGPDKFYCSEQCKETSKLKIMISDIKPPDNNKSDENEGMYQKTELNLVKKLGELMQAKMEVHTFREKVKLSEKEKTDLQMKMEMLRAENHQFAHLEKHSRKVYELQKDLSNKLKLQKRLKKKVEGYKKQLSGKNKTMKKMETHNKKLWNMVMQFVHKLENADLLTVEEKNILKKFKGGNFILGDTFDSEDEERGNSSMLMAITSTDAKQNIDSVLNKSIDLGSYSQTPKVSKQQGLLSMNSSILNSSRKLAFSHQQLGEFDAVPAHFNQQPNSIASNLNHFDLNFVPISSSSRVPYQFSAKRCHNGTVKLNFQINDPISMRVNPNNWEVSCILKPQVRRNSVSLQPKLKTAYEKPYVNCHNSMMTSEGNKPIARKISKVEQKSSADITVPVLKRSDQKSFVSFKKQNVCKWNIVNPDVSSNGNSVRPQHIENIMDDVMESVSSKNLSPFVKSVDLCPQESLLFLNNSVSFVSEAEFKELDNSSNLTIKTPIIHSTKIGNKDISLEMLSNMSTESKYSGFNSAISSSTRNGKFADSSELGFPMHPLIEEIKTDLPRDACFDEKSSKAILASHHIKNSTLYISSKKEMSKTTSLQGNGNHTKGVNNAETDTSGIFQVSSPAVSRSIAPFVNNSLKPVVSDVCSVIEKMINGIAACIEGEVETQSISAVENTKEIIVDSVESEVETRSISAVENAKDIIVDSVESEVETRSISAVENAKDIIVDSVESEVETQSISAVENAKEIIVDSVESEVDTQSSLRECRNGQSVVVDSSYQVNRTRAKRSLQNISLKMAKECDILISGAREISEEILGVDPDIKFPLGYGEDLREMHHLKEIKPTTADLKLYAQRLVTDLKNIGSNIAEECDSLVDDARGTSEEILGVDPDINFSPGYEEDFTEMQPPSPALNRLPTIKKERSGVEFPKGTTKEANLSQIEVAFQAIEKIEPTAISFEVYAQKLAADVSDPSISQSSQNLVFHLVKYLHNTKKKSMYSFFISNNPDVLLPISEQYLVKALLTVVAKNIPHLSGLLSSAIETMYYLVLGKTQYNIYGLSSLCRVMTTLCKELKDPSIPRRLCCDLLKYNHKFGPFLIASIVGVYKQAFEVLPYTPEEEKNFISALSYGVQQKPKTLKDAMWNHSYKVLSKYLILEDVDITKEIPYLKNAIEDKCLSGLYDNEHMLTGPLVILAQVKGWNWAQKHLLEDYIQPNLLSYARKENGERGFSFFADLCADICYGCPDEDLSRSWLYDFLLTPTERKFVQIYAGAALLKLILLRKELFPDKVNEWVSHNYKDPRVLAFCNLHFKLRLMEDHDLDFDNDIF